MKKSLLFLTMVLAMTTMATAQTLGPALTTDKDVHDFGTIEFGGNGTCTFTVTNTGSEPLIITECKKSCGCTTPKCDPNPIAPGASSAITVKYDTKRPGPFQKTVTVRSNDADSPERVLTIKGTVSGDPAVANGSSLNKKAVGAPSGN